MFVFEVLLCEYFINVIVNVQWMFVNDSNKISWYDSTKSLKDYSYKNKNKKSKRL